MNYLLCIFSIVCLNFNVLSAQNTYQKLIPLDNGFTNYGYGSLFKIAETLDHEFIIASTCLTNQSNNQKTLSVCRMNSAGDVIWKKHYNHFSADDRYSDFTELPDSSIIFVGYSNSGTILTRIDKAGSYLYSKLIPFSSDLISGSKIHLLNDTTLLISGRSEKPSSGIRGNGFILSDFDGNVLNGYLFVLNNRQSQTIGTSIITSDEKYLGCYALKVVGVPPATRYIPGIYKADLAGNIIWSHQFDDGFRTFDPNPTSFSLTELTDGGFIVSGDYRVDAPGPVNTKSLLLKIDLTGQLIWSKILNKQMRSQTLIALDSGKFIFAGTIYSLQGGSLPCLIEMNTDGTVINARYTDSIGLTLNYLNSTILDSSGSIVSINTTSLYENYFLSKKQLADTTGCFDFSLSVADSVIILTDTIGALGYSMVYTASSFSATAVSDSTQSSWICNPVSVPEIISEQEQVIIFPNPSNGNIQISGNGLIRYGEIIIYNSCGIKIISDKIHFDGPNSIDLSNQSNGVYYAQIYVGESCINKKILILKD